MSNLFLQIFVIGCFVALIIVLFFEKSDYLTYAFLIIVVAGVVSGIILPEEVGNIEFFIESIDWEVIFFLIGMFLIVEILNEQQIFQDVSRRIVKKYSKNIRMMFYVLCVGSTLIASILEDLSVAIIFGPIIVLACAQIRINPTPFLLGMTICINLAATLTPFGSAQNLLISNALDLSVLWFLRWFGLYFIFSTAMTLFLLDKFMLSKYLKQGWIQSCEDIDVVAEKRDTHHTELVELEQQEHTFYNVIEPEEHIISEIHVDPKVFRKNIIALVVFIVLLIVMPNLYVPCLISALIFVFLNPVKSRDGSYRPSISHYFKRVDYKLIYFFICLFVLVGLMEVNGTILLLEEFLENNISDNLFVLCLIILFASSILSAFMDNAPVTIIFLPIVSYLSSSLPTTATAAITIAFILGINLGGNFLPQGSACDMMTLEIAKENCVYDLSYKKLFKVGGLFALLHIILGIIYIAVIIYVIPI